MLSDAKTFNIKDRNKKRGMKEEPATFKQICQKICDFSIVGKSDLLFSTDMYNENSIKSLEKTSRGSGQKRIIRGKVQIDLKTGIHFLPMTLTNSSL